MREQQLILVHTNLDPIINAVVPYRPRLFPMHQFAILAFRYRYWIIGGKLVLLTALAVVSRTHDALDPLEYPDAASLAGESLGWSCRLRQ
jgi:hypothetical protein